MGNMTKYPAALWRAGFRGLAKRRRRYLLIWLPIAALCAWYALSAPKEGGAAVVVEEEINRDNYDPLKMDYLDLDYIELNPYDLHSTRNRLLNDDVDNTDNITEYVGVSNTTSLLHDLMPILENSKPSIGYQLKFEKDNKFTKFNRFTRKHLPRVYGKNGVINVAVHDMGPDVPILSKNYLGESLYLPDDLYQELKISHKTFVDSIPETYELGTYAGTGIVFIGGGKFSWLSLLSIENIRSVGSKLPIELIIPEKEDYEPQLCEVFLPKLNAKCVLLYDLLPKTSEMPFTLSGYQYKSIAILASSFENLLLLDSDNIAVQNPDNLFSSEPYLSDGMILWPDFWRRVTHPLYYDLAGYKISEERVRNGIDHKTPFKYYTNDHENADEDIPLHDRGGAIPDLSTESGQIVVNKKTHFKALLLSLYYNVYGPHHYYPLFSQGAKGEGDKETFIAAAVFFKLPVYQVSKPVKVVGHRENESDNFKGVGMVQFNPITNLECEQKYMRQLSQKLVSLGRYYKYGENDFWNFMLQCTVDPLFVHSNFPKLDPISLYQKDLLRDSNGRHVRLYGDDPVFGFDFEKRQWRIINKYFCSKVVPLELKYLQNSPISSEELCRNIRSRLRFLSQTGSL
jgi:alpha 1,2-mannosyltransferase